jgi:hypothetical protein
MWTKTTMGYFTVLSESLLAKSEEPPFEIRAIELNTRSEH